MPLPPIHAGDTPGTPVPGVLGLNVGTTDPIIIFNHISRARQNLFDTPASHTPFLQVGDTPGTPEADVLWLHVRTTDPTIKFNINKTYRDTRGLA